MKDASLFSSLDTNTKKKIYVVGYFFLDITRHDGIPCQHGFIISVYLVPYLNATTLLVSQLTKTSNTVEFWLDRFFVKDIKNDRSIVIKKFLNSKD
jgi:hypothetical protein